MSQRFEMRLSDELAGRIDKARGDVPRATWIKRAVESALGQVSPADTLGPAARRVGGEGGPTARSSAPSRPSAPSVPGLRRASSLVKRDVRPIPKREGK